MEVTVDSHSVVRSNTAQPPIPSSRSPVAAPVSPRCGNTDRKPTAPRPLRPVQISLAFVHSCVCVCVCVCARARVRFVLCSFVTLVHSSSQHAGQLRRTPRVPHPPFCSLRLSPPLRSRRQPALHLCHLVTSTGLYRWSHTVCDLLGQAFFAQSISVRSPCCRMYLRLSIAV